MAKNRRGRRAQAKTPLAALVLPKMEEMGLSISGVERSMRVDVDSVRGLLRGKTGRNRADKVHLLERLVSLLGIPLTEALTAAGLTDLGGQGIDMGTLEARGKRVALAGGGDPRLCGSALGVLAARGEASNLWGISKRMFSAGQRFAELQARATEVIISSTAGPRSTWCLLSQVMDREPRASDGGVLATSPADLDRRATAILDAYNGAVGALALSDSAFPGGGRPSVLVVRVAVNGAMPRFAVASLEDLNGNRAEVYRTEWLALRHGLTSLHQFFASTYYYSLVVGMRRD